jgi:GntR family transcriptional repressor for pyruvate dehydrogenase complex
MEEAVATSSFSPVRTIRLSEEIIRQIGRLIDNGSLRIDDRFPSERELQQRWQVSRPVLREAFRVLEMQGIVESRPGAGRYLRSDHLPDSIRQRRARLQASPERLLKVWEAREALECKAASLAALTASRRQVANIGRALRTLNRATFQEIRRYDLNRDFHMAVAKASNNEFLEELIGSTLTRSSAIGFKEALDSREWDELDGRHEPIYEAIAARDADAASAAVAAHFSAMRRSIGES